MNYCNLFVVFFSKSDANFIEIPIQTWVTGGMGGTHRYWPPTGITMFLNQ